MQIAVFEGYDGVVEDILNSQVKSIKIQTAYGPDIVIPEPFKPAPPPPPGTKSAAAYLKPRIEIQLGGASPITWAPYGDPRPSKWPWVKTALVGGVILGGLALVARLRARRR